MTLIIIWCISEKPASFLTLIGAPPLAAWAKPLVVHQQIEKSNIINRYLSPHLSQVVKAKPEI